MLARAPLRVVFSIAAAGGTAAAAPPLFRPSDPALCGSCPLVTPYYCRLGDLLCYYVYIVTWGRGTAAAVPPPFRPSDPALCGSCPLVTPYYCRLGDLLCYTSDPALCGSCPLVTPYYCRLGDLLCYTSDPALCGNCPLVTPYYCRLGDLLCYSCLLYLSSFCVCMHMCNLCFLFVFLCYFPLQLSPSVLWYCWLGLLTCKNRLPYNLYCVGGDVKHCSINPLLQPHQWLGQYHFPCKSYVGVCVTVLWRWSSLSSPFSAAWLYLNSSSSRISQRSLSTRPWRRMNGEYQLICQSCTLCFLCVFWVVFLCSFLLQYFDTVGWVFWHVNTVGRITYTVLVQMLNYAQSINLPIMIVMTIELVCFWDASPISMCPVWVRQCCRISPPHFLAKCRKRQLNQASFVLLFIALFAFSVVVLDCLLSCTCIFRHEMALIVLMCCWECTHSFSVCRARVVV